VPKAQAEHDRQLTSIQEAARRCAVHPDTIRRRIAAGQLTAYRFGPKLIRVDMGELEALLRPIPTARSGVGGGRVA
jgi:excisionase family DNA binding protein